MNEEETPVKHPKSNVLFVKKRILVKRKNEFLNRKVKRYEVLKSINLHQVL